MPSPLTHHLHTCSKLACPSHSPTTFTCAANWPALPTHPHFHTCSKLACPPHSPTTFTCAANWQSSAPVLHSLPNLPPPVMELPWKHTSTVRPTIDAGPLLPCHMQVCIRTDLRLYTSSSVPVASVCLLHHSAEVREMGVVSGFDPPLHSTPFPLPNLILPPSLGS